MSLQASKQSSLLTPASHAQSWKNNRDQEITRVSDSDQTPVHHLSGHDMRFEFAELLRSAATHQTRDRHRGRRKENRMVQTRKLHTEQGPQSPIAASNRVEAICKGEKPHVGRAFEFIAKDKKETVICTSRTSQALQQS